MQQPLVVIAQELSSTSRLIKGELHLEYMCVHEFSLEKKIQSGTGIRLVKCGGS